MELPIEFLSKLDIINLLAIAGMLWFFNSRLDRKFDKIDSKFEKSDKDIKECFDKLDEKVTDIDRRLCRLEGAFISKDCCKISDERNMKKAE